MIGVQILLTKVALKKKKNSNNAIRDFGSVGLVPFDSDCTLKKIPDCSDTGNNSESSKLKKSWLESIKILPHSNKFSTIEYIKRRRKRINVSIGINQT